MLDLAEYVIYCERDGDKSILASSTEKNVVIINNTFINFAKDFSKTIKGKFILTLIHVDSDEEILRLECNNEGVWFNGTNP